MANTPVDPVARPTATMTSAATCLYPEPCVSIKLPSQTQLGFHLIPRCFMPELEHHSGLLGPLFGSGQATRGLLCTNTSTAGLVSRYSTRGRVLRPRLAVGEPPA